jgi:hypothetical protein
MSYNFFGILHSFLIFFIPIGIFQANYVLLRDGRNDDLWTLSLTSFTCLFTCVTCRIFVWTRWWTKVSAFFYIIMSVWVYIGYLWISEYITTISKVTGSVQIMHESYLFWLSVVLIVGTTFSVDLCVEYIRMEFYPNTSDFLRKFIYQKE